MERLVPKTDKISNIFNSSHWPLDLSPSPRCWVFVLGCLSRHKAHASSKCAFHQSHRCPEVLKQERERSEKNPKGTKMIGHGDVRAKVSRSLVRIRGVTHTNLDSTDETDESSSLSAKPFIIASVAGFDWMSLILANKPITSDSFAILCEDVLRHRSKVGVTQKPMWPNFLPPQDKMQELKYFFWCKRLNFMFLLCRVFGRFNYDQQVRGRRLRFAAKTGSSVPDVCFMRLVLTSCRS